MSEATVVFVAVVGARFLVPLLIPQFPLTAIIACLILDGVDQTIFQSFGYDPPGYQGYDKAMDVYYLAIAYLSTMRNWHSLPAYHVGQFLYFYRLVGVVAFELTHVRALLLIFPNTFEYFFMFYEAVRSRWSPVRWGLRWWITAAGLIWVFIKLPQEYWIHIAQLDVTDTLANYSWALPLLVASVLALLVLIRFVVWPRLPAADWSLRITADPLPTGAALAAQQRQSAEASVVSAASLEKVVLMGLLAVVFAQTLPGILLSNLELFLGVTVVVVVNSAFSLALARRARTVRSTGLAFVGRTGANVVLVLVALPLLDRTGTDLDGSNTLFLLTLVSLLTTLHDRYQPMLATRAAAAESRSDEAPRPGMEDGGRRRRGPHHGR